MVEILNYVSSFIPDYSKLFEKCWTHWGHGAHGNSLGSRSRLLKVSSLTIGGSLKAADKIGILFIGEVVSINK